MKKATWNSFALIILTAFTCGVLNGQITFSRFDFNALPFINASIGPNAIAIDADVVGDGMAAYVDANCGGTKGLDITVPNLFGIFDQASMGMTFRFRKIEARSDFFVRGGTSFYQNGGDLYVEFRTSDGMGGFIDYGPYNTGYTMDEDGFYHEYTFIYRAATGLATVSVDGGIVWTQDGPDNRDFYWTGAPDPVVGTVMDGNCNGIGILDYAYFFIPDIILKAEYQSFTVSALEEDVQLDWTTANENVNSAYTVERSKNGVDFVPVGSVQPMGGEGLQTYWFVDDKPGHGRFYYRIRQTDSNGGSSDSQIQTLTVSRGDVAVLEVWPIPLTAGNAVLNVNVLNTNGTVTLTVMSLTGGVVLQTETDETSRPLDLSALSPGVYMLHCACGEDQPVQKIVIR